MRLVVQRVLQAEVQVDGQSIGKIGRGFLVLVGVGKDDTKEIADNTSRSCWDFVFLRMRMERQIFLSKMLAGNCFLFRSLRSMQTVRRETDQALSRRVNRTRRKLCMNI